MSIYKVIKILNTIVQQNRDLLSNQTFCSFFFNIMFKIIQNLKEYLDSRSIYSKA